MIVELQLASTEMPEADSIVPSTLLSCPNVSGMGTVENMADFSGLNLPNIVVG